MESFFPTNPRHVRLLVVSDVDNASAQRVAEQYVSQNPYFDAVIVSGPFTHHEAKTEEELSILKGEIGAIISQFENIVCRVVYLATESDPPSTLTEQLHLTPNSVNIHARRLPVAEGLFFVGFAETGDNLVTSGLPPDVDRSAESDDELDGVEVKAGVSSISVIQDLLSSVKTTQQSRTAQDQQSVFRASASAQQEDTGDHKAEDASTVGTESAPSSAATAAAASSFGVLILNYKFAHTLNHFLFHMPESVDAAGIRVCVLPPSTETGEPARLPKALGQLSIAALGSLRLKGSYTVIELSKGEDETTWTLVSIDRKTLNATE